MKIIKKCVAYYLPLTIVGLTLYTTPTLTDHIVVNNNTGDKISVKVLQNYTNEDPQYVIYPKDAPDTEMDLWWVFSRKMDVSFPKTFSRIKVKGPGDADHEDVADNWIAGPKWYDSFEATLVKNTGKGKERYRIIDRKGR